MIKNEVASLVRKKKLDKNILEYNKLCSKKRPKEKLNDANETFFLLQ